MAVDIEQIEITFNGMINSIEEQLGNLYTNDKIDAEMYAKVIAGVMQSTLQLATQSVQQQPTLDVQETKAAADTAFVKKQDYELSASVEQNNKTKSLMVYADMIGTMGAGSLTITSDMWAVLFEMIHDLNSDATIPANPEANKAT